VVIFIKPDAWKFLYELARSHDQNLVGRGEQPAQPGSARSGRGGQPEDDQDLAGTD
jgi:hypothetical protein